ncbi:hypothetical protein JZ751_014951 [Albula glossodonta]|uniref:Uncharacterized protein n=1 Tax=Albula glossodonta TaxID=121402 RepID=A0A8T2N594_9TELE|nr:hypothetical protein JZ751_014951 [Albula glossodonta]
MEAPANTKQDAAAVAAAAELAEQGSKCRGHRHEEVMRRQQEALVELRAKVKALEQTMPMMSTPGLCVQQVALMRKELSELRAQKAALYRGDTDSMYLDLARALCEALELSEFQLSGSSSLKHLPQDERERLGSHRQRDLELMRTRLGLLQSQVQRKEELLQEYHRDMGTLRDSQAASQQLEARLDSLRAELQTERQESSLLREALQRTQGRLEQEKGLNHAIKERKVTRVNPEGEGCGLSLEWLEKRTVKTPSHSCIQDQVREKKREYEIEALKKQLRNSTTCRPASAQRTPVLSEAH